VESRFAAGRPTRQRSARMNLSARLHDALGTAVRYSHGNGMAISWSPSAACCYSATDRGPRSREAARVHAAAARASRRVRGTERTFLVEKWKGLKLWATKEWAFPVVWWLVPWSVLKKDRKNGTGQPGK
jgi:hypothetical protein